MTRTRTAYLSASPNRKARSRPLDASISAIAGGRKPAPPPKFVEIDGKELLVSPVFDTLFYFLCERHAIHQRRLAGEAAPWTDDGILAQYPYTNVYRVYDRTTQYILKNVICEGSQDLHESCFRVMLFRLFNKPETWALLQSAVGEVTWRNFDLRKYENALLSASMAIYCPAYIIPAPKLGAKSNVSNHLRLIQLMMEHDLPARLKGKTLLKDAHGLLCLYPSMGDFTALQLLLDLNMLPHFQYSENEWVALGPGSTACIRKIFGPEVHGHELAALDWLHAQQHAQFARLRIPPARIPRLCAARAAGLSKVDLEHALCEVEKYSRALHPEIAGKRTKVAKHAFCARAQPPPADLPKHWLGPQRKTPRPTYPGAVDKNGQNEWVISHIVAEKASGSKGAVKYLVRWEGWPPEDDTWEPEANLAGADCLREWQEMKNKILARVEEFQEMGNCFKGKSGPPRKVIYRDVIVVEDD